jgi:hypothetical protein
LKNRFGEDRSSIQNLLDDVRALDAFSKTGKNAIEKRVIGLRSALEPSPPMGESPPIKAAAKAAKYIQDAVYSYTECLKRAIYDWIKQNGIEFDGKFYELPTFETWRKYVNEGLKIAARKGA